MKTMITRGWRMKLPKIFSLELVCNSSVVFLRLQTVFFCEFSIAFTQRRENIYSTKNEKLKIHNMNLMERWTSAARARNIVTKFTICYCIEGQKKTWRNFQLFSSLELTHAAVRKVLKSERLIITNRNRLGKLSLPMMRKPLSLYDVDEGRIEHLDLTWVIEVFSLATENWTPCALCWVDSRHLLCVRDLRIQFSVFKTYTNLCVDHVDDSNISSRWTSYMNISTYSHQHIVRREFSYVERKKEDV